MILRLPALSTGADRSAPDRCDPLVLHGGLQVPGHAVADAVAERSS